MPAVATTTDDVSAPAMVAASPATAMASPAGSKGHSPHRSRARPESTEAAALASTGATMSTPAMLAASPAASSKYRGAMTDSEK